MAICFISSTKHARLIGKIANLSIAVLLLSSFLPAVFSQRPPKLKFVPTEDQNWVGSQDGAFQLPLFPVNGSDVVLGGLFSLTDSTGRVDTTGVQSAVAFECAVNSLKNNQSLGLGDTNFYYHAINDAQAGPEGLSAAVDLLQFGVPVVVGPGTSEPAVNVAALFGSYGLTLVSGSATAAALANDALYSSFLRTIGNDVEQATGIASVMNYFNWSLVTPIYTDDAYGMSGQRQFTIQAQNNRILLTCGRVIKKGQLNGIQDTINCLASSQSNVVLLWMGPEDASNVLGAFYENSALDRLTFIASDAWATVQDFEIFSQNRFPISYLTGTLGFTSASGDSRIFQECFETYKPGSTKIPNFDEYWQVSFRCFLTDDESIPACVENVSDRNATHINCRCTGTENTSILRPDGKVNYYIDAVYAIANALGQIKNNCTELSDATGVEYCNRDAITSSELLIAIKASPFYGLTGLVEFDGNSRKNATFEILQQSGNGTETPVGIYTGQGFTATIDSRFLGQDLIIANNRLVWKTKKTPRSEIVPSIITISDPLGAIVLAFVVIGLVVSLGFSIFFFRHRKDKIIKKSSPFFCQLILIGIDLCLVSQIIWMVPQSSLTCVLKVWLLAVGFGLIMGNLLAKTYRIFKIFHNIRVTSLVIRDTDLLFFSAAVVLLEIALLSVYTFSGGILIPVDIQSVSDSLLIIVQCASPSQLVQTMMNITLLVVNGLLILLGVVIAYLTRNVDSAFNESKYIAITMYMYLLVTIILLPLYYTAGDSSSSVSRQFILRALAVLASMYFTLVALFVPKIMLVYSTQRAEKKASQSSQTGGSTTSRRIITDVQSTKSHKEKSGLFNRLAGGTYTDQSGTGEPTMDAGQTSVTRPTQKSSYASALYDRNESVLSRSVSNDTGYQTSTFSESINSPIASPHIVYKPPTTLTKTIEVPTTPGTITTPNAFDESTRPFPSSEGSPNRLQRADSSFENAVSGFIRSRQLKPS